MFLGILFSIFTLVLLGAPFWYVPHRLIHLLGVSKALLFNISVIGVLVLSMVCMMAFNHSTSAFLGKLSVVSGWIFGIHLFLLLLLLFSDLARLFIPLPEQMTAWTAIGLAVLITLYAALNANPFKVTKLDIHIDGLENEVTLMHIADVHIGHHRGKAYLERIVTETNRHKPDLILINGDLVDANSALQPGVLEPLSEFEAPVYFTTGNHEHYVDTKRALELISGQGVTILHNQVIKTNGFQLIGLDYMNADEQTYDAHQVNTMTIKEELPRIQTEPGLPVVLMHHSPVGFEYVVKAGVHLMLSGHTHAGQVFPATLVTPFMWDLNKGYKEIDGTRFFVSQGAGTFALRLRLGSSNEINLIHLTPATKG